MLFTGFLICLLIINCQSNTDGLQEVAWGGLIYCLGVVFFKSDGVIPFAHAIWHVFVATAAAVHYYAIWKYLYRSPADIIRHLWYIHIYQSGGSNLHLASVTVLFDLRNSGKLENCTEKLHWHW